LAAEAGSSHPQSIIHPHVHPGEPSMPPKDPYPKDPSTQLLVGLIFAESASKHVGGGENAEEKKAIGLTVLNAAYYGRMKSLAGKKCYNDSFGDGTLLSAIKTMAVAYNQPAWNKVMAGNTLKAAAELEKLDPDTAKHLELSIEAAETVASAMPPRGVIGLTNRAPVGFNQGADSPPSKRMERLGRLGAHTFYGFKKDRECQ
jgi:hypothetical protein